MPLRKLDLTIPPMEGLPEPVRAALNRHFGQVTEQLDYLQGFSGPIKLKNSIDLDGNRITNAGTPKDLNDLITKASAERNYGFSSVFQLVKANLTLDDLLDGDDLIDDQSPVAVQSLALEWGPKKKGYKSTWLPGSKKKKQRAGWDVCYMNSAETNFMVGEGPGAGQLPATNTEAFATFRVFTPHHTTHLSPEAIDPIFHAGVKVRVWEINVINGEERRGPSSTSSVVAVGGDVLATDTAAPVIANPLSSASFFKFKRGKLPWKLALADITNWNTPTKVEISVTTASAALNLDDPDSETPVAADTFYETGKTKTKGTLVYTKAHIRKVLGLTGTFHLKVRLTNTFGGPTTSQAIGSIDLATMKDISNSTSDQNFVKNWQFGHGTATLLDHWFNFNPADNTLPAIEKSTGKIRWDSDELAAWWRENTSTIKRYLIQPLPNFFQRGDQSAYTFFLRSTGSLTVDFDFFIATKFTGTGTAAITNGSRNITGTGAAFNTELKLGDEVTLNGETRTIDQITGANAARVSVAFTSTASGLSIFVVSPQSEIVPMGSQALTTTEVYVEGVLTFSATGDVTSRQKYLMFRPNGTISTAGPYLYIQRVCGVFGATPRLGSPTAVFGDNNAGTGPDFDSGVGATGGIGGSGQEPSGDVPDTGDFEIIQV